MNVLAEAEVLCPHCGESYPLMVDTSHGSLEMVEDCTVCCQPILLRIDCQPGEIYSVDAGLG